MPVTTDTRHSILGESTPRIRTSGRIRSGIMVPKRGLQSNASLMEAYLSGVRSGERFDAMNFRLKKAFGLDKAPLVPKNPDFFSLRKDDFSSNPVAAETILANYGDENGKLYRIPIRLPLDDWLTVMPHGLSAFFGREKRYWSEYDQSGRLVCMQRAATSTDQRARRAPRAWGKPRTNVRGPCDPESCSEYQSDQCSFRGRLYFYVHGAQALCEMTTGSWNGLDQMRSEMGMVSGIFHRYTGAQRLSGLADGKPFFWLAKRLENVAPLNRDTGQTEQRQQWIPVLEADTDLLESVLSRRVSVALPAHRQASSLPDPVDTFDLEAALRAFEVDQTQFAAYATARWGDDWSSHMAQIKEEIEAASDDPKAYRDQILDDVPF